MIVEVTDQLLIDQLFAEFGKQPHACEMIATRLIERSENLPAYTILNTLFAAVAFDKALKEEMQLVGLTGLVIAIYEKHRSLQSFPLLMHYVAHSFKEKHGLDSAAYADAYTQVLATLGLLNSREGVLITPLEVHKINFDQIIHACADAGITRVEITYCGSGDSGGVEHTSFEPADIETDAIQVSQKSWDSVYDDQTLTRGKSLVDKTIPLAQAIEEFFEDDCENYDIDFNGDGCNGVYSVDVATREVCVENSYPTTQTDSYKAKY